MKNKQDNATKAADKGAWVPKLRFPEFQGTGGWKKQTLADVCLRITNGKANAEDHENDGIYPLYDRSEVVKKSSEFAYDDEVVIIPGEGMRFQPKYYKGKFNLHQRAYALMQHQGDARFVYYAMDHFKDILAEKAVKSTVLSLRLPILERFDLPVASRTEQQKIADCLTSVDERISLEAEKLTILKTYKNGLMQQLFPTEGETLPKLRFPEFRDAGTWKEKTLNQITTAIFDGTHQTPTYTQNGIPFFSVENIVSGKLNKFISRSDYLEATRKNKPEKGDVLITRIGNIGFSMIVDWNYEFSIYVTLAVIKKDIRFNATYLHAYMQSPQYQAEIRKRSLLNAVPCKINMDELRNTRVLLPSAEEQQRIAEHFSFIDKKIAIQVKKIDALKIHKKGLMQQIFPMPNEIDA